jgi:hypothetical protein
MKQIAANFQGFAGDLDQCLKIRVGSKTESARSLPGA